MRADAKIRYNDRGAYDATKTYFPNDQVASTTGIFVARTNVGTNNPPETNTPATETAGTGVVSTTAFPYVDFAQRFTPTVGMTISGFRYYAQVAGDHLAGSVGIAANIVSGTVEPAWLANGVVSIAANTRTLGWNTVTLPAAITLTAGTTYVVAWYGSGKNVGYAGSSVTTGLFMTLGATFYNASGTASGPAYSNENSTIRAYFDWTFTGTTLPWEKIGELPPVTPVTENTAKDAIVPVDSADSWIIGSDQMNRDPADATKNRRAFFDKVTGAFRSGRVDGAQWDNTNRGEMSFAHGFETTANGGQSFASGLFTRASGSGSHAEGNSTIASGANSHAEGDTTTASGIASHAEGDRTNAGGGRAHAEGYATTASANQSHAEGHLTTASNAFAHAEGNSTIASGEAAHAEGTSTTASGHTSHAEGHTSTAEASISHAEGATARASRYAQYAKASGQFAAQGDAQIGNMVLRNTTTDATATVLSAVPANVITLTGGATNVLTLPASRAFQLKISTIARRTDVQGEAAGWTWEGVVNRDATGNAYVVGTPIIAAWGAAGAAAWALTVSINTVDTVNNYVAVTATGEALKTIRWVAKLEWTEVGG